VLFDASGTEELAKIVEINLARLNKRLADRRITVEATPAAKEWLALTGFDPVFGARPLRGLSRPPSKINSRSGAVRAGS
jgi:ATP-dependent Clp protease ATP-binding subunit ClpB